MHDEQHGSSASDPRKPQSAESARAASGYPLGRGYGHDYMRGGEVFGGYGYSARPEYEQTRGERPPESS